MLLLMRTACSSALISFSLLSSRASSQTPAVTYS
jgi:hypothetical protein